MSFPETTKILADQIRVARVDHEAFDTLLRPCEMKRCRATCCHDGVHIYDEEAGYVTKLVEGNRSRLLDYGLMLGDEIIVRQGKGLKTAVREAEEGELADDFPAHFPKTRCVFLNKEGFCGLQSLAMTDGDDAWMHKPLTCWMHPLVLIPAGKWEERPVLTIVNSKNDPQKNDEYAGYASCTHCGREESIESGAKPAWQVLENELSRLSEITGRDIYGELSAPPCDWV